MIGLSPLEPKVTRECPPYVNCGGQRILGVSKSYWVCEFWRSASGKVRTVHVAKTRAIGDGNGDSFRGFSLTHRGLGNRPSQDLYLTAVATPCQCYKAVANGRPCKHRSTCLKAALFALAAKWAMNGN